MLATNSSTASIALPSQSRQSPKKDANPKNNHTRKDHELAKKNEDFKAPFLNDFHNYIKIDNISTMHKHGYYGQWFHDAGIVFDEEPYIVVILTNHGRGNQYEVVHGLSEKVYEYHKYQL